MAVTIMCPNLRCRKILIVPNTARGTRVRCAYCGTVLMVPAAKPPTFSRRAETASSDTDKKV